MPDGLSENGIKRAANEYYENKSGYPYGVYINWPFTNKGNILYNDKKFVTLLYEANEDSFYDMSKISDAGNMAKAGIYRFLGDSERVVMMVDCENSDPYKLYATLNNLDQQALLAKISKIVLFDDVNTASAWSILEDFTEIPIEYILIERLKDNKSLVDIRLTASASREHYRDGVNDFILVSSDSDYWGLITELPEANLLFRFLSLDILWFLWLNCFTKNKGGTKMKEYEIHSSANYMTEGGTEEGDYYISYRWANSAAEAEEMVRETLKKRGCYNIEMDSIEA